MKITFNAQKNQINQEKHGVALDLAQALEWDWMIAQEDKRFDYGEVRMIGFAPIGQSVYCVVFVEEDDQYHIISLRKATKQEVKAYASQI